MLQEFGSKFWQDASIIYFAFLLQDTVTCCRLAVSFQPMTSKWIDVSEDNTVTAQKKKRLLFFFFLQGKKVS